MKTEPNSDSAAYLTSDIENQFIDIKEEKYDVSITFPVIKGENEVSYMSLCLLSTFPISIPEYLFSPACFVIFRLETASV
jgi:hypothetical protein